MPFDVFNYGDGAYCYYAVVVKNCDTSDNPTHFNEIQIQAIPFATDYPEGKDSVNSDAGKMWVPYVSDIVGTGSFFKDDNNNVPGYGIHSLPEVGSIVVVLAMRSGHASSYQHVVLGNFWNADVKAPKLEGLKYDSGNFADGAVEVTNESIADPSKEGYVSKIANTTYFKTKANTNIVFDNFNGIFGFYRNPQKEKVEDDDLDKDLKYMLLNTNTGNVDVKVTNFTMAANNVKMHAEESFTIQVGDKNEKDEDKNKGSLISAKKKGTFISDEDGINVVGNAFLTLKAKSITMNDEAPKVDLEAKIKELKVKEKETKVVNGITISDEDCVWCLIRGVVEINVLRCGEDVPKGGAIGDYVGKEKSKIIRLSKNMKMYAGIKKNGDTTFENEEMDLSLTKDEINRVLAPYGKNPMFKVESFGFRCEYSHKKAKLAPEPVIPDDKLKDPEATGVTAKYSFDVFDHVPLAVIELVRTITFMINKDAKTPKAMLYVHYLNQEKPFKTRASRVGKEIGLTKVGKGDRYLQPNYGGSDYFTIDIEAGDSWKDICEKSSMREKLVEHNVFSRKFYYADILKSLKGESDVSVGRETFNNGKPGIIKYEVFPCASGVDGQYAETVEQLSVAEIKYDGDWDKIDEDKIDGIIEQKAKSLANFNFAKNDDGKDLNALQSDVDLVDGNYTFGSPSDDPDKKYHVYVRYSVSKYIPLIMFSRRLSDVVGADKGKLDSEVREKLGSYEYLVFSKDLYSKPKSKDDKKKNNGSDDRRKTLNAGSDDGSVNVAKNKLWAVKECTSSDAEYENMLKMKPELDNEKLLFLKDVNENVKDACTFVTDDRSVYKNNAAFDMLVKWKKSEFKPEDKDKEDKKFEVRLGEYVDAKPEEMEVKVFKYEKPDPNKDEFKEKSETKKVKFFELGVHTGADGIGIRKESKSGS